jgi:hypothetical protein
MTATKLENLLTPGGRLISGSLTKKGDKDAKGIPIPFEKQAYWFAVAVPKTALGVDALIGQLWQLAATDFAQYPLVMQQVNLGLAATAFSWKIDDGDVPQIDQKTGQYRPLSEHRKGCYIFGFRTMFEFGACDDKGIDIDRGSIKVGDYVDVMFNATSNGNIDHTAGIYLNVQAIRRLGFGDSIGQEVKASSAFAGVAAVLPPGASVMPQAGSPMPGMPAAPAAPPVPPPAAFPPAGWTAHPSAPGYFYMGTEVKSEAELRAPLAAAPVPPPMVPAGGTAMPGMPVVGGIASPSSYPAILTGGMPGVVR